MQGIKRKSSSSEINPQKRKKMDADNESAVEKLFKSDQCIQAILAYLPIEDLTNASQASCILKMNAGIVFKRVHAATIKLKYDSENFGSQQKLFQEFGSLAKKVEFDMGIEDEEDDPFHEDGYKVLRTIGHFCGENLQDLTLRHMQIDFSSPHYSAKDRTEVLAVLSMITKLSLFTVCIRSRFFVWTRSLKELIIHSCCHMEELPEPISLPQLKVLKIGACPAWPLIVGENFNSFLRLNPSIEELNYHFVEIDDGYLASICSLPRLTQLEVILLKCNDNDVSVIAQARKLKKLTIHVVDSNHRQFSKLRKLVPTGCEYSVKNFGHE